MKDTHKALTIALASRILIIIVMLVSSFLFMYATTEHMNVNEMKTPIIGIFMRWDSAYYLQIAQNGYPLGYPNVKTFPNSTGSGSPMPLVIANHLWAFYPLYPAAMKALALVFTSFLTVTSALMLSGIIISNIAFFVSAYFFYKLTQKLFNSRIALISTAFYSFWVGAVFFSAIYTEALFMALALGAFYYLAENKLSRAVFLGFLASFTRSDGFLIAIPFLICALQSMRIFKFGSTSLETVKDKFQSAKLLISSAIVASPVLLYNIAGYFLAGGVFPVQVIAIDSNWGIYPLLAKQFTAPYCSVPSVQAFIILGLIFALMPVAYFVLSIENVFTVESKTLGYWAFYASMAYVLFTSAIVYSVLRYAIPMLPIYWISAKIYAKKRVYGLILFAIMTVMLIISAYLLEINSPYFM